MPARNCSCRPGRMSLAIVLAGLELVAVGCATTPVVTRPIYEDRTVWVRLETDPSRGSDAKAQANKEDHDPGLTSGMIASWMRGFRALNARGPVGMMMGRPGESNAFVPAEISALAPHLAAGLKIAAPHERVAYCMAVDWSPTERFITTGWVYVKHPYLHFKLSEYRTPVRVASPAVSTAEACRTKPLPGVKTADRFFRLEYQPEDAVVDQGGLSGLMAGTGLNRRGEVVFKLSRLYQLPETEASDKKRSDDGSRSEHDRSHPPTPSAPRRAPSYSLQGTLK